MKDASLGTKLKWLKNRVNTGFNHLCNLLNRTLQIKIKFLLIIFPIVASAPVFASDWINYEWELTYAEFYDSDHIEIVEFKNEQGKSTKGIRLRILTNFTEPIFKTNNNFTINKWGEKLGRQRDFKFNFTFNRAVQSAVNFDVYDCFDNLVYTERIVFSSAPNNRGTLVLEWNANPSDIRMTDWKNRYGYPPRAHTQRTTPRGREIGKIVRKFCSQT